MRLQMIRAVPMTGLGSGVDILGPFVDREKASNGADGGAYGGA